MSAIETTVYISGPMRGITDFNRHAFFAAEDEVYDLFPGEDVIILNPSRIDEETHGIIFRSVTGDVADIPEFDLRGTLGNDLDLIATYATHVYVLSGYATSRGALAEIALARALDLPVIYQSPAEVFTASFTGSTTPSEVRIVNKETGGEKGAKAARFDLIPTAPLITLATLYGKGAEKYADRNWERGYEWSLSYSALLRHAVAFWSGEDCDPEHGLPHLASVAWHAFAMMEWSSTHPELDNRGM